MARVMVEKPSAITKKIQGRINSNLNQVVMVRSQMLDSGCILKAEFARFPDEGCAKDCMYEGWRKNQGRINFWA
jgi:hypothetical protein